MSQYKVGTSSSNKALSKDENVLIKKKIMSHG